MAMPDMKKSLGIDNEKLGLFLTLHGVLYGVSKFANGIMGYLASPLWMAQLLIGIVLVLQSRFIRPEYFPPRLSFSQICT